MPVVQAQVGVGRELQVVGAGLGADAGAAVVAGDVVVEEVVDAVHPAAGHPAEAPAEVEGVAAVAVAGAELGEEGVVRCVVKGDKPVEAAAGQGVVAVEAEACADGAELAEPPGDRVVRGAGGHGAGHAGGGIARVPLAEHVAQGPGPGGQAGIAALNSRPAGVVPGYRFKSAAGGIAARLMESQLAGRMCPGNHGGKGGCQRQRELYNDVEPDQQPESE